MSEAEIEEVFRGDPPIAPDVTHSAAEQRFLAIGRSAAGRQVFVAFTIRLNGADRLIRRISARYMHQKEVAYHETHSEA